MSDTDTGEDSFIKDMQFVCENCGASVTIKSNSFMHPWFCDKKLETWCRYQMAKDALSNTLWYCSTKCLIEWLSKETPDAKQV